MMMVSGLGSFDYQSYVSQVIENQRATRSSLYTTSNTRIGRQTTQINTLSTRANTLLTSVKKFFPSVLDTSNVYSSYSASQTLTGGVTNAVASDYLTVTTDTNATTQNLSIKVNRLATNTRATSTTDVGQTLQTSTLVSDLGISTGNFTVFRNGVANTIAVNTGDTIQDVLTRIQGIAGVSSTGVSGGKLNIAFDNTQTMQLGSTGDTSNFLSKTQLLTAVSTSGTPDNTLTSGSTVSLLNLNGDMTNATGAKLQTTVTAGSTFKIGSATFTVNAGDSLNSIISQINGSTADGVTASFNTSTNRLELTSTTTGQNAIFLEDTSGNFLQAMGLLSGGNSLASQTLGQNASVEINGQTYLSTSNTVNSSTTGLTGVTLNLKQVTTTGATINSVIAPDSTNLKNAFKDLVTRFNEYVSASDLQTGKDGVLNDISGFRRLRNSLRSQIADRNGSATVYNSLTQIGLGTGAATGAAVTGGTVLPLQFNESTFDAAYSANPTEVTNTIKAIMGTLRDTLQNAVAPTSGTQKGLFQGANDSLGTRKKNNDDKLKRITDQLEKERSNMLRRFEAMQKAIQQVQSQSGQLSSVR
ncbi:MAG: flagellar filament capping protein FliD [Vampirovibrionales bacterium]